MERLASSLAQHRASKSVGSVMVDGVAIEDLCLTFTVPGECWYLFRNFVTEAACQ